MSLVVDDKLLKRYNEARQDENQVLSDFVETLKRVDNLPSEDLEQVRDALLHTDYPFLIMLVGPFSAGKSSIINALLGETMLDVGPVPTTDHIHILRYSPEQQQSRVGEITTVYHPNPLLKNLSFVDTPGLESVFEQHETVTRKFLHRADLVLMIMFATQVMSASNLDFLRQLRDYGKRSILVVNQVDVLDEADRETVQNFVTEQSRLHMGTASTVWLVSAKQALQAQGETPRNEILYDTSGFAEIEEYLRETLSDKERLRQKLETPLQIANRVHTQAVQLVDAKRNALSEQQKTMKNIEGQIDEAAKAQRRTADEGIKTVEDYWDTATQQGREAIRELFLFSRAFGQIFAGLAELVGIAALIRRFGTRTRAQASFDKHEVTKALNRVPEAVDQLGARLEGRDLQDLDDLVEYTRQQVDALPPSLKDKVIGRVQSPMNYDRSFIRRKRGELDDIISEASRFETDKLDRQLRNMLLVLAIWQIIVVAITLSVGITAANAMDAGTVLLFFAAALLMALAGMVLLPIRGLLFERAYRARMEALKGRYVEILREALDNITAYSTQLRRDTAAPYTRLVTSQSQLTDELKTELDTANQALGRIQRGISNL